MNRTGDHHVLVCRDLRWEVYDQDLSPERAEVLARLLRAWSMGQEETHIGRGAPPAELVFHQNPPWTTRAVAKDWDTLEELVGADLMPELSKPHASRKGELVAKIDALGCGAYGCVLPTNDPSVVLKITTDESEVAFARDVLPTLPETAQKGFTRYLHVHALDSKHERRPLYALWRQSAQDVGAIGKARGITDRMLGRERKTLLELIAHSWGAAQFALLIFAENDDAGDLYHEALEEKARNVWPYTSESWQDTQEGLESIRDSATRMGAALSHFELTNEAMDRTSLRRVGRALNAALRDKGVFVADVHEGNLGRVADEESGDLVWVVTDPGNTVMLPSPWR